jgi:uncharacterized protein (DUF2267 family)
VESTELEVWDKTLHRAGRPKRLRSLDEFLGRVGDGLQGTRPVNVHDATLAVFRTLTRHADPGQIRKIIDVLPEEVRAFWLGSLEANDTAEETSPEG